MTKFLSTRLSFKKVCFLALLMALAGSLVSQASDSPQTPTAAFQSLKLAADQGDASAQQNLGMMYYGGQDGTEGF